ncbi:GNAT family N-acetyltransferase [Lactovum odontotermitis]
MRVELRKINADNYMECLGLSVAEDQACFVASNAVSLAEAWVFPYVAVPLAVYAHEYGERDKMVGFVMLGYLAEEEHYEIWRLMIDQRFQGKGYGRAALKRAVDYMVKEFRADKVYLSVEPENTAAEKFYKDFGFKMTGEIEDDEAVMQLVL